MNVNVLHAVEPGLDIGYRFSAVLVSVFRARRSIRKSVLTMTRIAHRTCRSLVCPHMLCSSSTSHTSILFITASTPQRYCINHFRLLAIPSSPALSCSTSCPLDNRMPSACSLIPSRRSLRLFQHALHFNIQ